MLTPEAIIAECRRRAARATVRACLTAQYDMQRFYSGMQEQAAIIADWIEAEMRKERAE